MDSERAAALLDSVDQQQLVSALPRWCLHVPLALLLASVPSLYALNLTTSSVYIRSITGFLNFHEDEI